MKPVTKIQIVDDNGEKFFGEGPCCLLCLVEETGSVPEACRRLGVSLPSGWYLLAQAEDALGFPILQHLPDRSVLTAQGRKLLDALEGFGAAVQASADSLFGEMWKDYQQSVQWKVEKEA